MIKEIQLRVPIKEEKQEGILLKKAARTLKIDKNSITGIKVLRKSIDARKSPIIFNYKVAVYIRQKMPETSNYSFEYKDVSKAKEIHIIGFGPAGMYAALRCIELGFKPIVLERGKNVQDRRRDLRAINQFHEVNEDLEDAKRGLYSGAVGYFTPYGDFDFNVIIRSILYNSSNKYVSFSVGGAITAKSIPEKEYEECLIKAKAMREALEN